ncbi:MAG: hypothetical protein LH650_12855 [Chloroflexi bacterium]|nr:hypothetical protein [Chloroflexota bacterium]
MAINAVAVIVWLWSRATGLPFGPEANVHELAGPRDLSATGFEVVPAGLLVALSVPAMRTLLRAWRMRAVPAWAGALAWSATSRPSPRSHCCRSPRHGHAVGRGCGHAQRDLYPHGVLPLPLPLHTATLSRHPDHRPPCGNCHALARESATSEAAVCRGAS